MPQCPTITYLDAEWQFLCAKIKWVWTDLKINIKYICKCCFPSRKRARLRLEICLIDWINLQDVKRCVSLFHSNRKYLKHNECEHFRGRLSNTLCLLWCNTTISSTHFKLKEVNCKLRDLYAYWHKLTITAHILWTHVWFFKGRSAPQTTPPISV